MIDAIGTDWKTNLKTGGQTDRDERLYIDFRGKDYPDVSRDTRTYIDRGDCENTTDPMIRGEIDLATAEGAARYQTAHLLLWALAEGPAVLGFALCWVAGDRDWATLLFAVALVLLWINAPRAPEPTDPVGRMVEPEMNG